MNAYTQPGHRTAFSGRGNVASFYRIKPEEANKNILSRIDAYTQHREVKPVKLHNPYFVYGPREQFQIDLAEVGDMAHANDGVRYLFVCIDIFTKKLWVIPLRRKTAVATTAAMQSVLDEISPHICETILMDRGREWKNQRFQNLLQTYNIKIVFPESENKAGQAERVIKSLKRLIHTYLTKNDTKTYLPVLADLVSTYNNRPHRGIGGYSPLEAEARSNLRAIRNIQLELRSDTIVKGRRQKQKYKVGDIVRISHAKLPFTRSWHKTFTSERFVVMEILRKLPVITYRLRSHDRGDDILGGFYANEMQLVRE